MSYGVNTIHKKLRSELQNYVKSQYFGKSPLLLDAVSDRLDREGLMYREPYIESSPAYKTVPRGFETIRLPDWLKKFFIRLGNAGLGVYLTPFVHQIQALEAATAGRDLFVSTGTGSGKTECFMWPLIAKLAAEAHDSPSTWEMRGVRVMIMYPMNALVSDQISRLRRSIGDNDRKFIEIFRDVCGKNVRRPQFGMYTGRTPYPGALPDRKQDRQLKRTLELITESEDEEFFNRLVSEGKIPAKSNMQEFLAGLENGLHLTNPEDAELTTRFEMQRCSPDILITNYSMLEYMLMRPREQNIWNETRAWLDADPSNKLLFVIDEAHMYKGSSGGEVALLIRRLLYKLGIARDRVQFILTTASMPDNPKAVAEFFNALTASEKARGFEHLIGEREALSVDRKFDIDSEKLLKCSAEEFEGDEDTRLHALNNFWNEIEGAPKHFSSPNEAYAWMYEHLIEYRPFAEMIRRCRGEAVSLKELATTIFSALQSEDALKAVGVLLAIAPLARNEKDAVLFPARMHMLFRGIKGVYACTNKKCPHSHSESNAYGTLTLGEVFLSDGELTCPHCGSVVYELYNDRRCGALFFKGYVFVDELRTQNKTYLWRYSGQLLDNRVMEIHLFIPPDDYKLDNNQRKNLKPCWLDVRSGFIHFDAAREDDPDCRKLYYSTFSVKGRPNTLTFQKCPHCRHQFSYSQLTSFGTRGNQSFFNLIKTQFLSQPAVPGKSDLPNEGRKVLLFSDSRQRAATLARDMSKISDDTAARQLFALAADRMKQVDDDLSLNDLYGYFCLDAGLQNVQLFNAEARENFLTQCMKIKGAFQKFGDKRRPRAYISDAPDQMKEIILRLFCGGYNTLYDSAVAWLEPNWETLSICVDKLRVSEQEFIELFNAWLMSICDQNTALGHNFSSIVRAEVRRNYGDYGLSDAWKFSTTIREIMNWNDNSKTMMNWRRELQDNFLEKNADGNFYVNINNLRVRFDLNHQWHRCEQCKELTPYLLKGRCPTCAGSTTHVLNDADFGALQFWRLPIEDAVNKKIAVRVIDTEEHTAQLSHKDQRDEFWSKTENYELRFQDFLQKGELPVDILSSTTTMEVGIDIGSLVAIGLRNIPPMRENYQQRAGRAGRRGSSLSTIVTFCEDGPHDTLYFNDPVPMFRGDPRKPWIDVESEKLFRRHLSMIVFQEFLSRRHSSLDAISAAEFLNDHLAEFKQFAIDFKIPRGTALLPANITLDMRAWSDGLSDELNALDDKKNRHPEIFGIRNDGTLANNAKSLLDALFDTGIIPTYSFPINVVSTYVVNSSGAIVYQIERGLDIAISEYAPGRSIVVDKKTYQIGGLYYRGGEWRRSPARNFIDDKNYVKELLECDCGWFGLAEENYACCPFCGSRALRLSERQLLRPWGFAPKNAEAISEAQLVEEYSTAQPPEYSTLPEHDEMLGIESCRHIRMAIRKNQRVIMRNSGMNNTGFVVCRDCGAAVPNTTDKPLKNVKRPYKSKFAECKHSDTVAVDLGFDFVTDMLVLEFALDDQLIDTRNDEKNLWLDRAAQSVAEAFRLIVGKELDIEFGELVTGYRIRRTQQTFVDIYIYDNLSSGAGYSVRIASEIENLLEQTKRLLRSCNCATACSNCLKHYRNQYVHGKLDRHYGLNLLEWGMEGKLAADIPIDIQRRYIASIANVLTEIDCDPSRLTIYPAMWKEPLVGGRIYISDSYFKYAKPYVIDKLASFR